MLPKWRDLGKVAQKPKQKQSFIRTYNGLGFDSNFAHFMASNLISWLRRSVVPPPTATVPVAPTSPPLVKTLNDLTEGQLVAAVKQLSKSEIQAEYGSDPWLCNYFINWWEYVRGEAEISSYPWNITIPIADVCNARCTFCTSWIEGTRIISLNELDRFREVLPFARLIGIAGHGEPLAHPEFGALAERISQLADPRFQSYIITNGVYLDTRREALEFFHVRTYNVSLNAATPAVHETVMGLSSGAFDRILASLTQLIHRREEARKNGRPFFINISFVINRDNIHELADFVRLGNRLGVDNIYLRTLSPIGRLAPGLNYHLLPPYLHPEFGAFVEEAKEAIHASAANVIADVESWSAPVLSSQLQELVRIKPPAVVERKDAIRDGAVRTWYQLDLEGQIGRPLVDVQTAPDRLEDGTNPFGRQSPFHCYFVYHDLIINDFNMQMIPCCYMNQVPGFEAVHFDGKRPFLEYWNAPAFVALRRRLKEGPLYGACKKCPAQTVPY